MIRLLFTAAALLTLSACAYNKPYTCQLKGNQPCVAMNDVYDAARKSPRKIGDRQSVFDTHQAAAEAASGVGHNPNAYAEPGESGQPIFKQPRVYRVWLAPYVDADGNLRTGEYTYFSTPGEWAYGTTRETGSASGATFGPQQPGQLGFNPVEAQKKTSAPPKPSSDMPAPASVTTRNGITQPLQPLR